MSLRTIGPIESIGATVRFWREQHGWTRTRLAAETRIPLPTISDIEYIASLSTGSIFGNPLTTEFDPDWLRGYNNDGHRI